MLYTLRMMHKIICSDATKPWVILAAREAVASVPRHGFSDFDRRLMQIKAVWNWVRTRILFVMDPDDGAQTELLADSENILRMRAGDCDEHAILAGAMLKALGFKISIVVGGPAKTGPEHVFLFAWIGKRYFVVDTTMTEEPFGTLAGRGRWAFWVFDPDKKSGGRLWRD